MTWRRGVDSNLTPIQQALTVNSKEYEHYRMNSLFVGVILEVYPSDAENNRSAQQSETRRGYLTEAKILLVGTNASSNLIIDHAVITSPFPVGLDDYSEHLPRGSTHRVDGATLNSAGAHVDPYDLDGDWCVVGFLGGSLDQPFVLTWWPHPKNALDAATSGNGNPTREGSGQSLDQVGRHFQRFNGVEFVITDRGDIYLSTTYANSRLTFDTSSGPTRGRWTRETNQDEGGSILVELKPSQTLELAWDAQKDGVGVRKGNEAQLPQTNPRTGNGNTSTTTREKTYVLIDDENIKIETQEEVKVKSRTRIILTSDDEATINATNVLTLESASVLLGESAQDAVIKGDTRYAAERSFLTALTTFVTALTAATVPDVAEIKTAAITFAPDLALWVAEVNGTTHLSTKVSTE